MPKTITIEVPDGYKAVQTENGYKFEPDNELPKTWEEAFERYYRNKDVYLIDTSSLIHTAILERASCATEQHRCALPTMELAKAVLALHQLLLLREVYRDGWEPDSTDESGKYVINFCNGGIDKGCYINLNTVLSFQTAEIRDEFLKNFRDLIEEAKELL